MVNWCLIVATRGRVTEVDRLLTSLANLEGVPPRVILVDQNTNGCLHGLVAQWAGALPLEHLVIPPRGVSQARNAGLALLRDEPFVAFPDDDCIYAPDVLPSAEAAFRSCGEAEVLISAWSAIDEALPPQPLNPRPKLCGRFSALRQSPTYTLFFRRSAIARARGYDESLGPGGGTPWLCGEDADYLLRAGGPRVQIAFAPGIRVQHPKVETSGMAAKAFGYGRGRMRVLKKHQFPLWFQLLSILHPLVLIAIEAPHTWLFRWHLFRGRLHEWLHPHPVATP